MQSKTIIIPKTELANSGNFDTTLQALAKIAAAAVNIAPWHEKFPTDATVTVRAAHDGEKIYFLFECDTEGIRNVNTSDQTPVSEDSCVEVFLEPLAGGEYWNFEVNFSGALNASHRYTRPCPTRLNAEELAKVGRCRNIYKEEMAAPARVQWSQFICLPLSLMNATYSPGMKMRGNFYACSSACERPYYLCWNAIDTPRPDFHRPEFFGTLILQ